jgi:hypothetical protein
VIRSARRLHPLLWLTLAIVIPTLLILALSARPADPLVDGLPPELEQYSVPVGSAS